MPAMHESIVQVKPSLQSSAVEQPPEPPDPADPELLEFPLLELLVLGLPPEPPPPAADPPFPPDIAGVSPPHPTTTLPPTVPTPKATASNFSMCFISQTPIFRTVPTASIPAMRNTGTVTNARFFVLLCTQSTSCNLPARRTVRRQPGFTRQARRQGDTTGSLREATDTARTRCLGD